MTSNHRLINVTAVSIAKRRVDSLLQIAVVLWLKKKQLDARRRAAAARRRRFRRLKRYVQILNLAKLDHLERVRKRNPRRWWVRPRAHPQWFKDETPLWPDDKWVETFRMTKASFYKLVNLLEPHISKQDTPFRAAVPPDERLAIALFRLTTNMYFRNIADQFGRGKATCVQATNEVVTAICKLKNRFIRWPRGDELRDIINGFDELSNHPMVAGAVDGSHIPVLAPADQREEYYCHKGFYSINLQAVADFRLRFLNVFTGHAGRAHDARVFSASSICRSGHAGTLFDDIHGVFDGVVVKPLLLADAAYPLRSWLMKGYPEDGRLMPAEAEFNTCLNTARNVVERAFGILKARFRCLRKQLDMAIFNVSEVILACCCLHNFCLDQGEVILPEWEREAEEDKQKFDERLRAANSRTAACIARDQLRAENFELVDGLPDGVEMTEDGETVRRAIMTYLFEKKNNNAVEI